MTWGITLIILSLLAVPSLLLSRKPDAKEILDKIAPIQGIIGVIFFFWGLWGVISAILNLGYLSAYPIWWLTWFAGTVLQTCLGFILGYGLIQKYVLSNNEQAAAKGEEILKKLNAVQEKLGIAGIIVGIWMIIAYRVFFIV